MQQVWPPAQFHIATEEEEKSPVSPASVFGGKARFSRQGSNSDLNEG